MIITAVDEQKKLYEVKDTWSQREYIVTWQIVERLGSEMKIQDRVEQVRQYVAASGEGDKEAITMLLSACSDKGSSDGCLLSVKAFDNAADHILLYLKRWP